ncbi:bifunctional lysylphosphatidylglycerol flippase/synthetase MprF [Microbacterium oleivorans]|uniref:DUF2156 domain-containing protein n=1 Tax=Microbacterium oleivorans TaxID=273677 RepID=A0A7D5F6Y2_9MICO|nr:DUF2156 domain-containing protein [Microbacterium oleivorans]QLD11713.1 DUF2156 domain-containing protein [Microbacterium oleivorans]
MLRLPATVSVVVLVLAAGVAGQGLWTPTSSQPWWDDVSYGLPAFAAGQWWTPLTGTFLVVAPIVYVPTLLGFVGMGYLEWRRGWRVALAFFGAGQLTAVFGAAVFLWAGSAFPWPWAIELAATRDVGPSGGTMACLAACAGLFSSPWRQRIWILIFGYAVVGFLFIGTLADVEHLIAVLLVLAVTRSFRVRRASVRERRLLAFAISLSLGVIQILGLVVATYGPFGQTSPFRGPWVDVLVDATLIVFVSNGLRRGRRWAWVITVGVALLNVVLAALYLLVRAVAPLVAADLGLDESNVAIASSLLWLSFIVYLVAARGAFSSKRRRDLRGAGDHSPSADDARQLVRREGGSSLSWMATWEGTQYLRTSAGIVPYQKHLGVAIALADPLGPADGARDSVLEFVTAAERDAVVPCFFSAGSSTRAATPAGWRSLVIADDTIVDLPGLTFTGKAWGHVRTALNRAEREGVAFRLSTMADEPWGVRQQMRAISDSWVGDKDLPEMRFTLGTLHEAEDPEVRIALAVSAAGDVEGFLSWLPIYAPGGRVRGWTLDLMRRREGGFAPVMEFLIGASAAAFAEEGADIMSLSGAPLAHQPADDEGQIARLMAQLGSVLEPVYGFSSLHRFKQKFRPRYEPIYLLYRDEGDLARIGPALVRAFLPDASLRQYAAAGLDMVRHG